MTRLRPSPEQREILDLGLTSIRIRAGAGTGKTTTVAMVIANLVAGHGVDPERILGITFTNKAASELAERVRSLLVGEEEGRQAEVHTYHGFASQILAEFGTLVGVDTRVRVITPTFARQVLTETFHHTGYRHVDITYPGWLDKIRLLGDRLGDHLLTPEALLPHVQPGDDLWETRGEMLETLRRYQEDKRRIGVVDYADLVTLSTRLLTDHPRLAGEIRDRYQVVVLDEYQDTNPAQRVMLTRIFRDGFPVIAVGDEDQTIYEWRGASPENFNLFPVHFLGREPVCEKALTLNRRSSQVILDVANQIRRRANPEAEPLRSHQPDLPGEVVTYWAADAVAEAEWIADRLERLHEQGIPWSEMAVLFRRNRDFALVVEALTRHDIPVEVANLGGLLSVPEVAELRAWLTVLDRPEGSAALIEILFGSRYRLGLADLAPLSRWTTRPLPDEDAEEVAPISLLEAIEQIDGIDGIRPEAREAYRHFLEVYRSLLAESQGSSLVETCRLVLDHTRAWQDIESLPGNARLTARLNLYRLLDLAEEWSPLQGRPSLGAFLDYLEAMEGEPAEELDSAHLSGEEAVTLVTVHRAKGLEWEVVVIPAVVEQTFPAKAQQFPDPLRFPEHIPPEHRIDQALSDLPLDEGERKEYFREKSSIQEWRVAYVAATRARSHLYLTGSYWYGTPEPSVKPKQPSELFTLVEAHPAARSEGRAEEPPRPELLRHRPEAESPDPLFTGGWPEALRTARGDGNAMARLAEDLDLVDPFRTEVEAWSERLFDLSRVEVGAEPERARTVSVTGLVIYAQCPKRFYWSEVDPLPRRRNRAAEAGTELHRRIELSLRGHVPFDQLEGGSYDAVEEAVGESAFDNFLGSRFADARPGLVEAPFTLHLDTGYQVRGRIDAVYCEGPKWEIVDFKSGRPREDPSRRVQLEAYAVAAAEVDFGVGPPEEIEVTFAYLGGELHVESEQADFEWRNRARAHLEALTSSIESGSFDERPGDWCHSCDFLRFCAPGRAHVGSG